MSFFFFFLSPFLSFLLPLLPLAAAAAAAASSASFSASSAASAALRSSSSGSHIVRGSKARSGAMSLSMVANSLSALSFSRRVPLVWCCRIHCKGTLQADRFSSASRSHSPVHGHFFWFVDTDSSRCASSIQSPNRIQGPISSRSPEGRSRGSIITDTTVVVPVIVPFILRRPAGWKSIE